MKEKKLNREHYIKLYNEIINHGIEPDNVKDCSRTLEFTINDIYFEVEATWQVYIEDSSYHDFFGFVRQRSLEVDELQYINVLNCVYIDEENGNEIDLLSQFNYNLFWMPRRRFVKKIQGTIVRHGDEVRVRNFFLHQWQRAIFLYQDSESCKYYCALCMKNGKMGEPVPFSFMRPVDWRDCVRKVNPP